MNCDSSYSKSVSSQNNSILNETDLSYPTLEDVQFSEDDRAFLADQADKRDLLKAFVILIAGASAGSQLLTTQIKNGGDLAEYLLNLYVTIKTPGWADALEPIQQIQLSVALRDTQYHLQGAYLIDSRKLEKPAGKARIFFKNLADYYSKIR